MPTVLRALLLAALLTLVPIGIGVAMADDPTASRPAPPAYEGTALADLDTSAVVVRRAPFCDRINPAAVREAIGDGARLTDYGNGETAALPGGADVAHEFGCVFTATGDSGGTARAWVFAPPVTAAEAAALAKEPTGPGCAVQPAAPAYGGPSVAELCRSAKGSTATFRGLFGDAWLSCSLTLPGRPEAATLLDTAGTWCVAVAQATA